MYEMFFLPQDHDTMEMNYASLHFTEKRAKRGRKMRGQPQDIVYSDVRYPSRT